jgi:hypothetical protein
VLVLKTLFGRYPFLKKLFADGGYQGPVFAKGQKKAMLGLATAIVKRSDTAKGFEVLPRRWVVERTFAWLGRCRRLAKDFENLSRNALAFLKLASIRLMLRRLCSKRITFRTDSKEFMEASKRRLSGDTARQATSPEVKDLRSGALALKG